MLLLVLLLAISNVHSNGLTYQNIEEMLPSVINGLPLIEQKQILFKQEKDFKKCIKFIFNEQFLTKLEGTKQGKCKRIIKNTINQLVTTECIGSKPQPMISRIHRKICSSQNIQQGMTNVVIQKAQTDLIEAITTEPYHEYVNGILQWFIRALNYMSSNVDKKPFNIRLISGENGNEKFKEQLMQYYETYPFHSTIINDKKTQNIIDATATEIVMERLKLFRDYDELNMFKIPQKTYTFDTLMHMIHEQSYAYASTLSSKERFKLHLKLEKQKQDFEEQDDKLKQDKQGRPNWLYSFIFSLYTEYEWRKKDEAMPKADFIKHYTGLCEKTNHGTCTADTMAIRYYTDNTEAATAFRRTFRCDMQNEGNCRPDLYVPWRMQMEHRFQKLDTGNIDVKKILHHGISKTCYDWDLLKHYGLSFTGPMSFSTELGVAENFAHGDCNIILYARNVVGNKFGELVITDSNFEEAETLLFDGNVQIISYKPYQLQQKCKYLCNLKISNSDLTFKVLQTEWILKNEGFDQYLIFYTFNQYFEREWDINEIRSDVIRYYTIMEQLKRRCTSCPPGRYDKLNLLHAANWDIVRAISLVKKKKKLINQHARKELRNYYYGYNNIKNGYYHYIRKKHHIPSLLKKNNGYKQ